ncbi:MAG: DHHW family protein [Ruminococcus sp.]|nr:DHHW family protein [Ruminococcus sp.]
MNKAKKLSNRIIIAIFLIFIFGFATAGLLNPDREFSEMENRNLAQFPEFSLEALKKGDYTAGIESYMSDQVFLKDSLVSLKTDLDRVFFKTYQNGVYFCEDGYYIQQYTENKAQIDKNIGFINDFVEKVDKDIPIDFILVPNAVSVHEDKIPRYAVNDDQQESIEYVGKTLSDRVNLFNAYPIIRTTADENKQVFYKTDHHWTDNAVKAVFEEYVTSKGESFSGDTFDNAIKREDFYGTLYSKAPSSLTKPDSMILPVDGNNHTVEYVKEGRTSSSLIDKSFLDKKDKYASFLGGNFSRVNIKSEESAVDEKVLILKDSYANAMLPYLANQYSDLTVVDMRYYHFEEQTVSELVKNEGIDRVILIYNMDFINSDDNFIWLE